MQPSRECGQRRWHELSTTDLSKGIPSSHFLHAFVCSRIPECNKFNPRGLCGLHMSMHHDAEHRRLGWHRLLRLCRRYHCCQARTISYPTQQRFLHCSMRCPSPRALFRAAWAALAGVLLHCLAQDALLLRWPSCDTTYIYEGYEQVQMAREGRYRLIKFADGDRSASAGRAGVQKGADDRSSRDRLPKAVKELPRRCCRQAPTAAATVPLAGQPAQGCSTGAVPLCWSFPSSLSTVTWAATSKCGLRRPRRGGSWHGASLPTPTAGHCGCSGTQQISMPRPQRWTAPAW